MCKDFECTGKPDCYVLRSDKDILREYNEYYNTYHRAPNIEQIEMMLYLRKVADALIDYDTVLFHGAVISYRNNGFLFMAPSGTGKTTHILKWIEKCPDAFVVNGDKPFILLSSDQTPLACSSPWAGKENLYTNAVVPLKSIIMLERAEENKMNQVTFAEAFPFILQQTYHSEEENKMRKAIRAIQNLKNGVSFWRFQCNNMKENSFEVAYNALVGKD